MPASASARISSPSRSKSCAVPGSSFAGRGTTGGAINIVTKQATTEKSFYNMDTTFGTDHTKRVVLDVNQVISPTLAIRAGGLFQDAGVAGRNYIKDDRDGGFVAAKWTPLDAVKLYANYIHTDLHGLPDFGVPYYRPGSPIRAGNSRPRPAARIPISASAATISTASSTATITASSRTSARSAARSRSPRI